MVLPVASRGVEFNKTTQVSVEITWTPSKPDVLFDHEVFEPRLPVVERAVEIEQHGTDHCGLLDRVRRII
jgi:hypothetical protein